MGVALSSRRASSGVATGRRSSMRMRRCSRRTEAVQALGFGVGFGADDADGEGGFGCCSGNPGLRSETWGTHCGVGDEVLLVVLDGLARGDGREEVGEGVGQALLRGGHGRPHGGAEQPDVGCAGSLRLNAQLAEGVVEVLLWPSVRGAGRRGARRAAAGSRRVRGRCGRGAGRRLRAGRRRERGLCPRSMRPGNIALSVLKTSATLKAE